MRILNKFKEDRMDTKSNTPSADRIYAVVARILERRYGVRIEYTLVNKSKEAMP